VDPKFWRNRSVLVTGHSGFKGSWLALWLSHIGAKVTGMALEPPTTPSLFELACVAEVVESVRSDVRDLDAFDRICRNSRPEIVFHMAGQSLVRESYRDPVTTFSTNTLGTVNCLEGVRRTESVRAVVIVTTDKCYRNRGSARGYRETDELGGTDPYAASKACAEIVTEAYRSSFFSSTQRKTLVASVRAGNVIGGGDWAVDRLVPDAMRAFSSGQPLRLRNPSATRPWQHVLDPMHGYLMLAEKLLNGDETAARAWNFGPDANDVVPVGWIADQLVARWGDKARWQMDDSRDEPKEAEVLSLDSAQARRDLHWTPRLPLSSALDWVVDWYKGHQQGNNPRADTLSQIEKYMLLATRERQLS
jgi:CDP-glucose 4,6-dehydratase